MKLNPDCIRDILLDVEAKSTFENAVNYLGPEDIQTLAKYSYDEIMYHIRQCDSANFFIGKVKYYMDGGCTIIDLSPVAHEFLANIRKDTTWNKTKEIATTVGAISLSTLKEISIQVVSNLISNQLSR